VVPQCAGSGGDVSVVDVPDRIGQDESVPGFIDGKERTEEGAGVRGRVRVPGDAVEGEFEPELFEDGGDELVGERADGHGEGGGRKRRWKREEVET
jgi:hypothetical protein